MNDDNSLLIDTKTRYAKNVEQYWGYNKKGKIGQADQKHTSSLMVKAYKEYDVLMNKFLPNMQEVVKKYSWENAAQMIIDSVSGNLNHYKNGTYNYWP